MHRFLLYLIYANALKHRNKKIVVKNRIERVHVQMQCIEFITNATWKLTKNAAQKLGGKSSNLINWELHYGYTKWSVRARHFQNNPFYSQYFVPYEAIMHQTLEKIINAAKKYTTPTLFIHTNLTFGALLFQKPVCLHQVLWPMAMIYS